MDIYLEYLRKSRADKEFIEDTNERTLDRHRRRLSEIAKENKYYVENVFEEIVSGDSIAARPEMQKLLSLVETGNYAGVLVYDLERLGRGNSIDQGIIQQTFKYSNTKIITPIKTYDFNNEFDEEYAEFGMFMGRKEYKMTKRRLLSGRLSAIEEGKYVAGNAPYGYETYKLKGQKGYSLKIIPDQAEIVKLIFNLYVNGLKELNDDGKYNVRNIGCHVIARKLNELGYKNQYGKPWNEGHVSAILKKEVYTGKIVWYNRKEITTVSDGLIKKTATKMTDAIRIVKNGLHEPIIDDKTFERAQVRRMEKIPKVTFGKILANPFAGVLKCGKCGSSMWMRGKDRLGKNGLFCCNVNCDNKGVYLDTLEESFISSMRNWLNEYEIEILNTSHSDDKSDIVHLNHQKEKKIAEIELLNHQLNSLYDLLEQGIYDRDTFKNRHQALTKKRDKINEVVNSLNIEIENINKIASAKVFFIPKVNNLIDCFLTLESNEVKNSLLKEVCEKISYTKMRSGRGHSREFTLEIYPKIF